MRHFVLAAGAACVLGLLSAPLTLAMPMPVVSSDTPLCDVLAVPRNVHELGLIPPFPIDEALEATSMVTNQFACPADNPQLPNALVIMTNLSTIAWTDVWYVTDPLDATGAPFTTISNEDGLLDMAPAFVAPGQAFKIDYLGMNRPLIFESLIPDAIFQPGETWHFIIDDYVNVAGLPAHLFDSIGVASASLGGPPSSGSIIAVVPEPATLSLLAGVAGIALLRRRE